LENVLDRNFNVEAPNRAWVGDITYVWTREVGFVFVAILLDLFARRVVGWSVSRTADAQLACTALEMAIGRRDTGDNLVVHHDRGVQYRSKLYQARVAEIGAQPSFSRKGNCWDNAVAESFFATMKTEIGPKLEACRDEMEVRAAVAAYVERFYNVRRLHSAIDYEAPARYEERMAA
jgi:transposase InsO family protein